MCDENKWVAIIRFERTIGNSRTDGIKIKETEIREDARNFLRETKQILIDNDYKIIYSGVKKNA